jgi:organizing structure protein 2
MGGVPARLKSLAPPSDVEPLFPGALWVGISALSGCILAPKPSTIRRIIYPPAWGFLAAIYFLPLTTNNVGKYIVELEDRYIPGVAKKQKELAAHLRAGLADGKGRIKQLRGDFAGQVDKLTDMVRERTGLKIGEKGRDESKKSSGTT